MLSNAYFLAKFRFDTAENEPAKNLQNFRKMHFSKNAFSKNAFFENAFAKEAEQSRASGGGKSDAFGGLQTLIGHKLERRAQEVT